MSKMNNRKLRDRMSGAFQGEFGDGLPPDADLIAGAIRMPTLRTVDPSTLTHGVVLELVAVLSEAYLAASRLSRELERLRNDHVPSVTHKGADLQALAYSDDGAVLESRLGAVLVFLAGRTLTTPCQALGLELDDIRYTVETAIRDADERKTV